MGRKWNQFAVSDQEKGGMEELGSANVRGNHIDLVDFYNLSRYQWIRQDSQTHSFW